MPLAITPATPLTTTAQLPVATFYALVETQGYHRKKRQFTFTLGFYASEAAARVTSGAAELDVPLNRGFLLQLDPEAAEAAAAQVGGVTAMMEGYAEAQLLAALGPDTKIETVP